MKGLNEQELDKFASDFKNNGDHPAISFESDDENSQEGIREEIREEAGKLFNNDIQMKSEWEESEIHQEEIVMMTNLSGNFSTDISTESQSMEKSKYDFHV